MQRRRWQGGCSFDCRSVRVAHDAAASTQTLPYTISRSTSAGNGPRVADLAGRQWCNNAGVDNRSFPIILSYMVHYHERLDPTLAGLVDPPPPAVLARRARAH